MLSLTKFIVDSILNEDKNKKTTDEHKNNDKSEKVQSEAN